MTYSAMNKISANYDLARSTANNLLKYHKLVSVPINILKLMNQYNNLTVMSFREFANRYNITVKEVITTFSHSKDGCITYSGKKDKYVLLYNDDCFERTPERIRFTLAHEFGHYILGHHKLTDNSRLSRGGLTELEHDVFEKEADCFASEFLAPTPYLSKVKPTNLISISKVFGISEQASSYRLHRKDKIKFTKEQLTNFKRAYEENLKVSGINYYPKHDILRNFYTQFDFDRNTFSYNLNNYFCNSCNHYESCKNTILICKICGSDSLEELSIEKYFKFHEYKEQLIMKYSSIDLDNNSKAKECPKCNNEVIGESQEICQICSTYLVNKCTGIYNEEYVADVHYSQLEGCGEHLNGDARFCISCGAISSFAYQELLSNWENEYNAQFEIYVDEDEFPF